MASSWTELDAADDFDGAANSPSLNEESTGCSSIRCRDIGNMGCTGVEEHCTQSYSGHPQLIRNAVEECSDQLLFGSSVFLSYLYSFA